MVQCPACQGSGVKVDQDDRGKIPEPEKRLGSVYERDDQICPWCAGCGRILNRKAGKFHVAIQELNS